MARTIATIAALSALCFSTGCMTLLGAAVGGAVNGREGASRGARAGAHADAAILRGVARSSREARRSSSPSRRARRRARHRNRQRYACTDATGLQYGVRAKNAVGAQLACEDAGYTQCVCTPY
ncbi:MAG TPA: hypothetical protein RMH85_17800 [Polyangiaceae bacterium LLY-WYZ-15_(1-7)]|nr:hypothetical protein [Myxococcales bacterium]MAT27728.1 hypothetical protein [Sandaracinus sp.]HJK94759.1 hypothetical protein [Polyangiaceae bacterium LLY-WYZ-15_(1-7)]MBJ74443.1 hypothetical protein [Sandaracinus sp.]HJK99987.1 hypothetical protein [Polyangiaceae bacterium LLY-WYZ-15_(1-7)]